ncbi:MAG TPA: ABC transporter substrate-binding protein [Solirubrobacterales bacterium]|nr:ABC transporter substrate-binding protein [Solirubrobacterales bacterium]
MPEKVRELRVTLDGFESPENVGIVLAEKLGYFAEAGLQVVFASPATPLRPVPYVVDGTDEIGISHEPEVILAKERGAPIVAVGSLVSQPTAALVWTKRSQIAGIADLKGKTIAIPGLSFQKALLQSVLARGGLTLADVKVLAVGYELAPALISGRADATFGGSWIVEGPILEGRGLTPVITPVQTLGIPAYEELVVIARSDLFSEEPDVIRAFMSAVARGNAAAVEDPEGAVEALEESIGPVPRSAHEIEAAVRKALPFLSTSPEIDPGSANRLVNWMYDEGAIERKPSISALLTNAAP